MQRFDCVNEMPDKDKTDESMLIPSLARRFGRGLQGVLLGLALNVVAAGMAMELLACTPGSAIRPMGLCCRQFLIAAAGLFVGFPISIVAVRQGKGPQRWLGILGVLLNLAVFPVGEVVMGYLTLAMNLTWEP